jgi:hypothetical protein
MMPNQSTKYASILKVRHDKKKMIKKIKYKKGNLIDHAPNIIIAVVCLALLVGLVVLVYKIFVNDEYKAAQKTVDIIETKIGAIGDGETTKFSIQSPCKKDIEKCKWFIAGWSSSNPDRPDKCYFRSCICVCPDGKTKMEKKERADICQKTGICRIYDLKSILVSVDPTYIYEGASNSMQYAGVTIARRTEELNEESDKFRYISLDAPLIELQIKKQNSSLNINKVY